MGSTSICLYASHDLVLAELRDMLRIRPGPKLDVRFVGSRDSIVALCNARGELAGFQLIVRTKARFINRQRGSGTRLAVEKLLKDQGIDRAEIVGFYSEEFTHLAVAAAVASGMADVGIGIEAAARKLRLQFIPMFTEDYYLLAKKETLEQKNVMDLLDILKSAAFRSLVSGIPGYDATGAGTVKTIAEAS